jgi:pyruvate dehydrogenase E1 component alpha subunit
MNIIYTAEDLKNFEIEIGECFRQKLIRAPIHLYNGNETQIIKIFEKVEPQDWVFCSWRSHYQCLLKGVPKEQLKSDILKGRSISLCYPEYNIFSSAIVGGVIPIANGVAFDLKRKNSTVKVYCFVGDMTSETGCFHENYKYSLNYDLPISWIVEDNNKSVCTDTRKTWNKNILSSQGKTNIIYYNYESEYPHAGPGGERIQF